MAINITQIRMKRGNTAASSTYVGPLGELLVDTGLRTIRVQDGATPGGMATLATNVQLQALGTYANATFGTSSYGNANVALHLSTSSIIGNINANITAANVNISSLTSNAATQATLIDAINANVTAANAAITSLTSNAAIQASLLDTLTGNAASQSTLLDTLTSNAATQSISLTTLLGNAVTQQTSLTDLVANAAVQAQAIANAAGTYSNANVAVYLSSQNITSANIGGTQTYANTQVNTINANLGAYQTFANANAASQATSLNAINANIGGFYTWANTNFGTSSYANANVTSLLSSNTVATINTTGNITTVANVIGTTFRFANGVNILSTVSAGLAAPSQSNTNTNYNIVMNNSGTLVYGSGNGGTAATLNPYTGYIGVSGMTIGGYGVTASTGFDYVVNLNSRALTFTQTGNLSVPGNVVATSAYYGTQYNFANGVNILSTVAGTYSNANVNTYLSSSTINTLTTSGNLTVGGNLIVNGNTTVINTASYTVDDNIIQMADGNPADSLDLGFIAHRTVGATLQHTGLVRDASDGNWKLFSNVIPAPGNTVDFTNAIYDAIQVGAISSPTVTDLYANAAIQSANIATLFSNAATQAGSITTLQTQVYANANVATYLPTYSGDISANIVKNGQTWTFGTDGTTLFPDQAIDGGTAPIELKSRSWSQLTYNNSDMSQQPNKNHSTTFYVEGGDALLEIFRWDSGNVMQHRQWTFSNDGSLSLPDTGTITFPDATVQNTAFSNAAVATYLSNYDGGINFTASPAVITGLGNISSANFTFANGVNILSTVGAGAYGNTEVAAYIPINPTITALQANVGSFYTYANATYSTGGGSTYSNANVVSMLAANSVVYIGNVGNVATYSLQANNTQVFIGGNAAIASGNAATTNSTSLLHNMYFAANGTASVRNTGAGVGILSFDPSGFSVSGLTSVQTANATPALTQWIKANTAGTFFSGPVSSSGLITAAGAVAVNNSTGITTNQATIPLFNQTATTILFGGAATSISLGSATIGGSGSNVFVGNAIGTSSGNLTVRAFGTYNSVNSLNSSGGYATTTYSNIAVTGGSGTGMLISMSGAASGYLASATVTNPGTGYRNGETITIPAGNPVGSLGGSFVIGNYNAAYSGQGLANYTFGIDGNLTLPGNVTLPNIARITYANGVNYASTITGTYSNTNVASYLTTATITTTGNITAGNLTATGTFTVADITTTGAYGNITGANVISANTVSATNYLFANGVNILSTVGAGNGTYSNANVIANLQNLTTNVTTTANVTAGNIVTTGATSGNISGANWISANVFQVSTGIFWANGTAWSSSGGGTTYSNANVASYLTAGNISVGTAGYTVLPNTIAQFTGTANTYVQINTQNISSGSASTSEIVATANNGNDTTFFIDLGIAGNTYNNQSPNNSLGTIIWANDSYLYAQGNTSATVGGNLAIGATTPGRSVTIFAGGINNTSNVATFANTGVTVYGNITAANIITTGTYGNITNANVISANNLVVTTTVRTIPVTFAALPTAASAGAGARAFITDGNVATFGSQVGGSGANAIPVYSNGTNWYVG